jgi:hypothetical protein
VLWKGQIRDHTFEHISLSLRGCRIRIGEPVSWSSNSYHGRRIRNLVVKPVSPLSSLSRRCRTRILVIELVSPSSNPPRRCRTRIVVAESLALSPALGIVVGPSRRGVVQGHVERWERRSCWRQSLRRPRIRSQGGRKERERRKRTTGFILGHFHHALTELPTSWVSLVFFTPISIHQ